MDNCHLLQKFTHTPTAILQFFQIGGPRERDYYSYELLMDRSPTYGMQIEVRGQDRVAVIARGGFYRRGRGRGGMGLGGGCKQLICYNCGGPGHYACDCTNPTRISCPYCEQFDHEMIDFPTLITEIHEKRAAQPTTMQNVQMMRSEPREEDSNVSMILKSGVTIGEDKGKLTKGGLGVRKTPTKQHEFDWSM